MKKLFLLFAALFAFTACSEDPVLDETPTLGSYQSSDLKITNLYDNAFSGATDVMYYNDIPFRISLYWSCMQKSWLLNINAWDENGSPIDIEDYGFPDKYEICDPDGRCWIRNVGIEPGTRNYLCALKYAGYLILIVYPKDFPTERYNLNGQPW